MFTKIVEQPTVEDLKDVSAFVNRTLGGLSKRSSASRKYKIFKTLKLLVERNKPKAALYDLNIDGNNYKLSHSWFCPTCNHDYETVFEEYNFCPNCGQRIDRKSYRDE